MKEKIIKFALKTVFIMFIRGWIKKKITDPKKKWDDTMMKALDQLFD